VRASNGTTPTNYTYTGQYSNMGDFGLMFYNARWYDPSIGRFAQADTLIPSNQGVQAWDRYAYSNNNPLLYTDPSGHCITLFGISLACPTSGSLGPLIFVRVEERESAHISVALPEDATAGWIVDPPYVPLDTGALINVPTAEDDGPEGFDPSPNSGQLKVIAETEADSDPYPTVIDPRTGEAIPEPPDGLQIVPKDQRVPWGEDGTGRERYDYIKEWYDRGYQTPEGGWQGYDIHHIIPREYGGTNDFWNLVPVERTIHQQELNPWWQRYGQGSV